MEKTHHNSPNANLEAFRLERKRKREREYYARKIAKNPEAINKRRARLKLWLQRPEVKARSKINANRYKEKHRILCLVRSAIHRARKNGKPFDEVFLFSLINKKPEKCPCCKVKFNYNVVENQSHSPRVDSPSLDRVDGSLGYVKGNVEIICWRCNALKRDATLDELKNIIRYMTRKRT